MKMYEECLVFGSWAIILIEVHGDDPYNGEVNVDQLMISTPRMLQFLLHTRLESIHKLEEHFPFSHGHNLHYQLRELIDVISEFPFVLEATKFPTHLIFHILRVELFVELHCELLPSLSSLSIWLSRFRHHQSNVMYWKYEEIIHKWDISSFTLVAWR